MRTMHSASSRDWRLENRKKARALQDIKLSEQLNLPLYLFLKVCVMVHPYFDASWLCTLSRVGGTQRTEGRAKYPHSSVLYIISLKVEGLVIFAFSSMLVRYHDVFSRNPACHFTYAGQTTALIEYISTMIGSWCRVWSLHESASRSVSLLRK